MSGMQRIEIFDRDDPCLDEVLELYLSNRGYFALAGTEMISSDTVLGDLDALPPSVSRQDKHFYLYREAGRSLAVLDLILRYPDDDSFFIGLFMVEGSRQRSGIGSRLYRALERELRGLGFKRGRLGVLAQNEDARCFWEHVGYMPVKMVVDTGQRIHVMEKVLDKG